MPYDLDQAVRRALAQDTNVPDTCQLTTRLWCGVQSVGDFDGDGAADAEDGWKSEPAKYRHARTVAGVQPGHAASYLGGSHDNGHRAMFVPGRDRAGRPLIRSTDAAGRGRIATVDYLWPVREWGLEFAGWSETCDGVLGVKTPAKPVPVEPAHPLKGKSRVAKFLDGGPVYDMRFLRAAAEHRADARRALAAIEAAVKSVPRDGRPSRVTAFLAAYHLGSLRLGLLTRAVEHGRTGRVLEARDRIRAAIEGLR